MTKREFREALHIIYIATYCMLLSTSLSDQVNIVDDIRLTEGNMAA